MTATIWYCFLVLQPWLYNQKNIKLHRKMGFIGLFIAGGLVFSALQVIPNNLTNERLQVLLRYGLSWADFIFLIGFTHAVIMAMLNSKNISIHARYMIASVIWALMPALSRLIYFPLIIGYGFPPPISFIDVIYISSVLILIVISIMVFFDYRKEKKIYNSYLILAAGTLFFAVTFETVGNADWWIAFCNRL
jgi:hypothetical protein